MLEEVYLHSQVKTRSFSQASNPLRPRSVVFHRTLYLFFPEIRHGIAFVILDTNISQNDCSKLSRNIIFLFISIYLIQKFTKHITETKQIVIAPLKLRIEH